MKITMTYDISLETATAATVNTFNKSGRPCDTFDVDRPVWFGVQMTFSSMDEAQAVAALFPKSTGIKVRKFYNDVKASFSFETRMCPDNVNKGANETGLRRIRSFFRTCEKNGIGLTLGTKWGNSSPKDAAYYGWVEKGVL